MSYAVEGVAVHPGRDERMNIVGRLVICTVKRRGKVSDSIHEWESDADEEEGVSLPGGGATGPLTIADDYRHRPFDSSACQAHLLWQPYDQSELSNRYAVDVRLDQIYSMTRVAPSLGHPRLTIVLQNGVTLPPLYFHEGGLSSALRELGEYVLLTRSDQDADTYLVADLEDRLANTLHELRHGRGLESTTQAVWTLPGWNILEKFSRITQYVQTSGNDKPTTRPDARVIDERRLGGRPPVYAGRQSSVLDCRQQTATNIGTFEVLSSDGCEPVADLQRTAPVDQEHLRHFMDSDGRVVSPSGLLGAVFAGGIEPQCRKEIWRMLLNYDRYDATFEERRENRKEQRLAYETLKQQWTSITPRQEARFGTFRDYRHRIEKDVHRTDRAVPFFASDDAPALRSLHNILLTYAFYNFDLGYVQGMSDLLAVILYVMEDDADAFWCFSGCMDMMLGNFELEQAGIQKQLADLGDLIKFVDPRLYAYLESNGSSNFYFAFRWLLVNFKREFTFDETMRLWEILWTRYLSEHFQLFFAAAIIESQRMNILENDLKFEDILKMANDLSGHIPLDKTLELAESLYRKVARGCPEHLWPLVQPNTSVGGEARGRQHLTLLRSEGGPACVFEPEGSAADAAGVRTDDGRVAESQKVNEGHAKKKKGKQGKGRVTNVSVASHDSWVNVTDPFTM